MLFKLQQTHLSIREFPPVDLPNLVFITGLNGSGKSHLLQAISSHRVTCDAFQHQHDIRLFNLSNMVPNEPAPVSAAQLAEENTRFKDYFFMCKKPLMESLLKVARNHGATGQSLNSVTNVLQYANSRQTSFNNSNEVFDSGRHAILKRVEETSREIENGLANENANWSRLVRRIAEDRKKEICALEEADFDQVSYYDLGENTVFQQQFGKLFVQYLQLQKDNYIRKGSDQTFLTQDEFIALYNRPPWDFVNETFSKSGLDFKISAPSLTGNSHFTPRLTKVTTGAEVKFANLSSGEKVIMSFALCLYYASDRRQITTFPKLLLLDELDAPLHPSMCKHFVKTISDVLVKDLGISVIATTHSPTTIAFVPEESVFVMQVERPGLHPESKAKAINILTAGVPALSIDYSGRRQVFVESPDDAEVHSEIYQVLRDKKYLVSERSLEFLSTGTKNTATRTHQNTGCSNVLNIVRQLSDYGNTSVFGFIDWDLERFLT